MRKPVTNWFSLVVVVAFLAHGHETAEASPKKSTARISALDMAAFSRVIAEDPLQSKGFPYNVRAVVYQNPNDCSEYEKRCNSAKLFFVIIGDGEAPAYKVYEAGDAADWTFVRWVDTPDGSFDDAFFGIELKKIVECASKECASGGKGDILVRANISLNHGFSWAPVR